VVRHGARASTCYGFGAAAHGLAHTPALVRLGGGARRLGTACNRSVHGLYLRCDSVSVVHCVMRGACLSMAAGSGFGSERVVQLNLCPPEKSGIVLDVDSRGGVTG